MTHSDSSLCSNIPSCLSLSNYPPKKSSSNINTKRNKKAHLKTSNSEPKINKINKPKKFQIANVKNLTTQCKNNFLVSDSKEQVTNKLKREPNKKLEIKKYESNNKPETIKSGPIKKHDSNHKPETIKGVPNKKHESKKIETKKIIKSSLPKEEFTISSKDSPKSLRSVICEYLNDLKIFDCIDYIHKILVIYLIQKNCVELVIKHFIYFFISISEFFNWLALFVSIYGFMQTTILAGHFYTYFLSSQTASLSFKNKTIAIGTQLGMLCILGPIQFHYNMSFWDHQHRLVLFYTPEMFKFCLLVSICYIILLSLIFKQVQSKLNLFNK